MRPQVLLCLCDDLTRHPQIQALASRHMLDLVLCENDGALTENLRPDQVFSLALICVTSPEANPISQVQSVRRLTQPSMPTALIIDDPDHPLVSQAMNSGVTEIFLPNEQAALDNFICACLENSSNRPLSGRVLILEDNDSHAHYIRHLCEELGFAVDHARTIESAQNLFAERNYQLLIIDVVLDERRTGNCFVREIRQTHAGPQPILVISGFDDLPRRLLALRSGADDFLSKSFSPEEFAWRIRRILASYAAEKLPEATPQSTGKQRAGELTRLLSPREREICESILNGRSDREIAVALGISFWTVRGHIQQIFIKTGAVNRRDLMARFITA